MRHWRPCWSASDKSCSPQFLHTLARFARQHVIKPAVKFIAQNLTTVQLSPTPPSYIISIVLKHKQRPLLKRNGSVESNFYAKTT